MHTVTMNGCAYIVTVYVHKTVFKMFNYGPFENQATNVLLELAPYCKSLHTDTHTCSVCIYQIIECELKVNHDTDFIPSILSDWLSSQSGSTLGIQTL